MERKVQMLCFFQLLKRLLIQFAEIQLEEIVFGADLNLELVDSIAIAQGKYPEREDLL